GASGTGLFPGTLVAGMNPGGDISGFYTDAGGVNHGFLRSAAGTITAPLDAPAASATGMFKGTIPLGINGTDEMAGLYADTNGVFHAFLLTPGGATATPTFSPPAGTYTSAQMVTISDSTPGASIFFTTDGTTPTTASTMFTTPISVTSTETIQAIA